MSTLTKGMKKGQRGEKDGDILDCVHLRVSLFVVGSVDENLVKYFIEAGHIGGFLVDHLVVIVHPHGFRNGLGVDQ